jgi:hypothetical protein
MSSHWKAFNFLGRKHFYVDGSSLCKKWAEVGTYGIIALRRRPACPECYRRFIRLEKEQTREHAKNQE